MVNKKITPFLWFDNQAKEAANFYTSVFKNSKIITTTRYDGPGSKVSGQPEGSVMTIEFELNGTPFIALNGGPVFKFNESISFVVTCKDQEEIDYFWEKLSADPAAEQCGWCKDKFGLSWQIVPENLSELLKNEKATQALMEMKKLDIQKLKDTGNE